MENQYLHIVSFNVPWPADYGGVIDVFWKMKALHKAGVKLILHCFQYGRPQSEELEKYCYQVHYYRRSSGIEYYFQNRPYIIATRNSLELCRNLLLDDHPILFEGLHSTYPLIYGLQKDRYIMVRAHNIEHEYYLGLARQGKGLFNRIYLYSESLKLKKYEEILKQASVILPISKGDESWFEKYSRVIHLPAFHPFEKVETKPGTGNYILYHGNLSVEENRFAVLFLLNHVFPDIDYPIIIAGKEPGSEIKKLAALYAHVTLIENPGAEEMDQLLSDAQINILPSFQDTGLKLKVLYALFRGRHCLVNSPMIRHSGLGECCTVADTSDEMKQAIHSIMQLPFSESQITERSTILMNSFNNETNAQKVIDLIK